MAARRALGVIGEGLLEVGLGPDVGARELRRGYGGDAANIAVMAARVGTPTRLATRVGDDATGRVLLGFWREVGIAPDWIGIDRVAPTGIYVNELLPGGGHRFDYHRLGSAATNLSRGDLDDGFLDGLWGLAVTGLTLSLSPAAHELAREAALSANEGGAAVAVVANCRPARSEDFAPVLEMLRAADIAILSEEDALHLLGTDSPEDVVAMLDRDAGETVLTLGGSGALLFDRGRVSFCESLPIDPVVDRAGAGDALAGAYLALRAQGADPVEALSVGIAAASLSCREAGCALSYPSRVEIERARRRPTPLAE